MKTNFTKYLVLLSIVLSWCSFYTLRLGVGECYPFFNWRLFSRPSGTNVLDSIYRIYAIQDGKKVGQKFEINDSFFINEQAYLLKSLAITYEIDKSRMNEIALLQYVNYAYPKIDSFQLTKEIYKPKTLLKRIQPKLNIETIYSNYEQ